MLVVCFSSKALELYPGPNNNFGGICVRRGGEGWGSLSVHLSPLFLGKDEIPFLVCVCVCMCVF